MKVWRAIGTNREHPLTLDTAPDPHPRDGEILVRIHAAGVTPTELLWYPTTHTQSGTPRQGAIPAHEFSGVVAAVGGASNEFAVNQQIYGMNDWFSDGALAEYCITRPEWIAPKPARLTFAQAAAVPIGALTAWQGLFDRAKLAAGETVLIHGAAGAVGLFAVQLAKHHGAHVIATGSASSASFLMELGAERFIDYHAQKFEDHARGVNVVFDAVGGETLQRSWNILAPDGRIVTIAADSEGTADERTKKAFFIVEPNQHQLHQISAMLDAGQLRPFVQAEVPMSHADTAYSTATKSTTTRGKVVVITT